MTEEEEINEDSELLEDLGISSMDILMLMASLEEEFKISIPEKEIRKMYTVGDVVEVVSARIG
jgi:acyl carrier protein